MNKQGIVKSISTLFPTEWHSAIKFEVNQILISIAMSSFCGINRICKIASFTGDGLVRALLKLDKAINENAISATLYNLEVDILENNNVADSYPEIVEDMLGLMKASHSPSEFFEFGGK